MNIYAGNLSGEVTEEDLQSTFESYGNVSNVNLIKERFSGESRGFGFVEMSSSEEAKAAIEGLNGTKIMGKSITVNEALPKNDDRERNHSRVKQSRGSGYGKRW